MKAPFPLHPFLFALYPVLFVYTHNVHEVPFRWALGPGICVLVGVSILLGFLTLGLRQVRKAALIASFLCVMVFGFGHFRAAIMKPKPTGEHARVYRLLSVVFGGLTVLGCYAISRLKGELRNATQVSNLTSICAIAIQLLVLGAHMKKEWAGNGTKNDGPSRQDLQEIRYVGQGLPPDIFYLIFDRYASARVLKEYYDFDNSNLIQFLENRGFYVAHKSHCNYPSTFHSFAASLNLDYINEHSQRFGEHSSNLKALFPLLEDYRVWRQLKTAGYEFVHMGSWSEPTRENRYADINISLGTMSRLSWALYEKSMLYPIGRRLGFSIERTQFKRVRYKFEQLAALAKSGGPKFVFCHMLIPHGPYVFDEHGHFVSVDKSTFRPERVNYIKQLVYLNSRIEQLMEALLSSHDRPPVIVLQADEGPHPAPSKRPGFRWKDADDDSLTQKMGILNAYYLPGIDRQVLYESISPVNTFRLIFDSYFGTSYGLLPDKSYVFEDHDHLYDFLDVTDRLKF